MGELERCLRERPVPEPEIARRARVPTGEVGAESKHAGAVEEPCPTGAEAVRRVVAAEVLVVDPGSDIVVRRHKTPDQSDVHVFYLRLFLYNKAARTFCLVSAYTTWLSLKRQKEEYLINIL